MLRKIMIVSAVIATLNATGQEKNKTPQGVTDNTVVNIDYRQVGTPMPDLRVLLFHDTARKDSGKGKHISKKEKKRHTKEVLANQTAEFITADDLKTNGNGNLFIMMFNPTCSHCDEMTTRLEKNIDFFDKSKILLMASSGMKEYLPEFTRRHNIEEHSNMYIGFDSSGFINNTFLYQPLPQINIYNPARKLIKIYTGEIAIDSLKQYAK